MDADEAQARMQEIQRIMERATLFTLLPGHAGGRRRTDGAGRLRGQLCHVPLARLRRLPPRVGQRPDRLLRDVVCHRRDRRAAGGGSHHARGGQAAARASRSSDAGSRVLADAQRGRGHGLDGEVPTPRRSKGLGNATDVELQCPAEPKAEEIQYIVPVWMMLYGTGVYTAGLFSIRPPRHPRFDVYRHGRFSPCCASRNTALFRRRCRSACCTSFSGSTSSAKQRQTVV